MKALFRRFMRWLGYEPISRRPVFTGFVVSVEFHQSPFREDGGFHKRTTFVVDGFVELRTSLPEPIEFELKELPWSALPVEAEGEG